MPGSELLAPAAGRVGTALAGAFGVLVVAERCHLRDLTGRVLFLRWRTWAVTAPLFGAAVLGPRWTAVAFVAALALQGLREFAHLVDLPDAYRRGLCAAGVVSLVTLAWSVTLWRSLPPLLLLAASLGPLLAQDLRHGLRHLAAAALGYAYVPLLLGYFLLLRDHVPGGAGLLLAIGTAVAISDIGAFVTGSVLGTRPLAPRLSPSKTLEGLAGNVAGAYAGFALMGFALPPSSSTGLRAVLPLVVALGCVWGDLLESLLKRRAGAKDAGAWLPGFGGLLDRMDSLLVVLPLAYTTVVLWP